jgi:hypothetical protein
MVYRLFQFIYFGGQGTGDGGRVLVYFVQTGDKVCEIFDGVLVYIFHEGFNGWFWDF